MLEDRSRLGKRCADAEVLTPQRLMLESDALQGGEEDKFARYGVRSADY